MLRLFKLFVPLANRGVFKGSLAGAVVLFWCVPLQAQGVGGEETDLFGGAGPTVAPLTPGIPGARPAGLDRVNWVIGPAKVTLAEVAELEVPADYRFADAQSSRNLLERMGNPVPKNLVGFLVAPSAEWFALIELSEPGFVRDDDGAQLDSEAILGAIQRIAARQKEKQATPGAPAVEAVSWVMEPAYDSARHAVEWAIRAVSGGQAVVNYIVRHLGRTHILDFVGVVPERPELDLAPLKQVAKAMYFKAGQRYEDFQAGDKVANNTLAQLLVNQDREAEELQSAEAETAVAGIQPTSSTYLWIAGIAWGVLMVGVVVLVYRAWTRPRQAALAPAGGSAAGFREAVQLAGPAKIGSAGLALEKVGLAQLPVGSATTPGPAAAGEIGHARRHRKRYKRYMYDKFYSRMIMRLSGCEYGAGGGNGESEPVVNHAACPLTGGVTVLDFERELAAKTSELIDTQTKLIEVQRRFIEEQRKLIEEQRKVFYAELEQAKNQLELFSK